MSLCLRVILFLWTVVCAMTAGLQPGMVCVLRATVDGENSPFTFQGDVFTPIMAVARPESPMFADGYLYLQVPSTPAGCPTRITNWTGVQLVAPAAGPTLNLKPFSFQQRVQQLLPNKTAGLTVGNISGSGFQVNLHSLAPIKVVPDAGGVFTTNAQGTMQSGNLTVTSSILKLRRKLDFSGWGANVTFNGSIASLTSRMGRAVGSDVVGIVLENVTVSYWLSPTTLPELEEVSAFVVIQGTVQAQANVSSDMMTMPASLVQRPNNYSTFPRALPDEGGFPNDDSTNETAPSGGSVSATSVGSTVPVNITPNANVSNGPRSNSGSMIGGWGKCKGALVEIWVVLIGVWLAW